MQEEAICKHDPETPPSCLGKAHLKWTEAQWKTVLWSHKTKFEILFGSHGHPVPWTKERRDHLAF